MRHRALVDARGRFVTGAEMGAEAKQFGCLPADCISADAPMHWARSRRSSSSPPGEDRASPIEEKRPLWI